MIFEKRNSDLMQDIKFKITEALRALDEPVLIQPDSAVEFGCVALERCASSDHGTRSTSQDSATSEQEDGPAQLSEQAIDQLRIRIQNLEPSDQATFC